MTEMDCHENEMVTERMSKLTETDCHKTEMVTVKMTRIIRMSENVRIRYILSDLHT